jgi:hypothetical protein
LEETSFEDDRAAWFVSFNLDRDPSVCPWHQERLLLSATVYAVAADRTLALGYLLFAALTGQVAAVLLAP